MTPEQIEAKCVAGCKMFTGGEIYHHKDCPFYEESFSKMYDMQEVTIDALKERVKELEAFVYKVSKTHPDGNPILIIKEAKQFVK